MNEQPTERFPRLTQRLLDGERWMDITGHPGEGFTIFTRFGEFWGRTLSEALDAVERACE